MGGDVIGREATVFALEEGCVQTGADVQPVGHFVEHMKTEHMKSYAWSLNPL